MTQGSENNYIHGTWVNRMRASLVFQEYSNSLLSNPPDKKVFSEISNYRVTEKVFSIDFTLDAKTFYGNDLHSSAH